MNRRNFISKIGMATTVAPVLLNRSCDETTKKSFYMATWNNEYAVEKAMNAFKSSRNPLDGIEHGIREVEANPLDASVGLGGRPDREGNVTLDACIMDNQNNAGSVVFVKNYRHPISIARRVMEDTPHVILAGQGAEQFAESIGMKKEELLTKESKIEYTKWLKEKKYQPIINIENHDTIGMLSYHYGDMYGGCSTSGLAYKMHGRVGDSPIIGAGLFVDNEVGCCVATGLGEKVLKTLSAFLVVELIRSGLRPKEACKKALERILSKEVKKPDFQVALIAVDKKGEHGAYAIYNDFNYVIADEDGVKKYASDFFYKYN